MKNHYLNYNGVIYRWDEVNYLGIGLYEAWMNESIYAAHGITMWWKQWGGKNDDGSSYNINVFNSPTHMNNVFEWLQNGYNAYGK
jgi:hypothetical protein